MAHPCPLHDAASLITLPPYIIIGHASNKACVEFFCTAELASPVAALYGPQLTCKLTVATAEWLKAVGQVPDQWKQTVPYTAGPAAPAAPADKVPKSKTGAAAVPSAVEGVCLDRSVTMLQV